jgi:Ca-activated chloride channel homolog
MGLRRRARMSVAAAIGVLTVLSVARVGSGQRPGTGAPPEPRPQEADERPLVVTSDLVTLTVTVTDGEGRHVTGLDRSTFAVYDNKEPQEISFFSDADAPASVAVVFDVSGSMSEGKIERAREALARFVETSHPMDEFYLIGFNSSAQLLLEKTRDADAVAAKLTYVEPRGNTALYDAVYLGLEKLARGAHRRRVLLLISDGEDNRSRYSFGDVRRSLEESDVIIYGVGIGTVYSRASTGRETLEKLSAASGGRAFFPGGGAEVSEAFERIALELRHQYLISYKPSNLAGRGEWHRVKVKVTAPPGQRRVRVRSREGYYAGP